jgi:hypothetical protein
LTLGLTKATPRHLLTGWPAWLLHLGELAHLRHLLAPVHEQGRQSAKALHQTTHSATWVVKEALTGLLTQAEDSA